MSKGEVFNFKRFAKRLAVALSITVAIMVLLKAWIESRPYTAGQVESVFNGVYSDENVNPKRNNRSGQ